MSAQGTTAVCALDAGRAALCFGATTCSSSCMNSSPAVANGVVYVIPTNGNVSALGAKTGTLLWSKAPGGDGCSPRLPAVANGLVYVGGVSALNASCWCRSLRLHHRLHTTPRRPWRTGWFMSAPTMATVALAANL